MSKGIAPRTFMVRVLRQYLAALVLSACALSGCAGRSVIGGSSDIKVSTAAEMPPPSDVDLVAGVRPYLIGPFDKLTIDVFGIEELTKQEVQADASGRISFPLAGVIEAAGQTPQQLAATISQRLKGQYVRDPQVTVNLKETLSQLVTVDGEVKEPGLYPVVGRMTLMRAIATAKGVDENARLSHVVVFRTVGGQRLAGLYNLKAVRNGAANDPEIYANDIVVVGDDAARRIFKDVLQVLPAVTTPLVYILTRN